MLNQVKIVAAFFVMTALITGCTPTKTVVIESTRAVLYDVDPRYLQDCRRAAPPGVDYYLSLSSDEKEDSLTRTLIEQYRLVNDCTQDKRTLRKLLEEQKKKVEEYNQTEAARVMQAKGDAK